MMRFSTLNFCGFPNIARGLHVSRTSALYLAISSGPHYSYNILEDIAASRFSRYNPIYNDVSCVERTLLVTASASKAGRVETLKKWPTYPHEGCTTCHMAFNTSCLKQEHGDYCPICGDCVPRKEGCNKYKIHKNDLLAEPPKKNQSQNQSSRRNSSVEAPVYHSPLTQGLHGRQVPALSNCFQRRKEENEIDIVRRTGFYSMG